MKDIVKKRIEDIFKILQEIGNFCLYKKEQDHNSLELISDNLNSTMSLLSLYYDYYDELKFINQTSDDQNIYTEIGYQVLNQTKFVYINVLSSIEFKIKTIILESGDSPLKKYLQTQKPHNRKLRKILKESNNNSVIPLISESELKEWEFFLDIRNSFVHNNAILNKKLSADIYGQTYNFEENHSMSGSIKTFAIFTKRVVEIYFNWVQNYYNTLKK